MRVVEPKIIRGQGKKQSAKKEKNKLWFFLVILVAALFSSLLFYKQKSSAPSDQAGLSNKSIRLSDKKTDQKIFKNFTGQEFRNLYNTYAYPNTQQIGEATPITGIADIDTQIRKLATERGYIVRSAPVTDTFEEVAPYKVLQQRAAKDWKSLEKSAITEDVKLLVIDAYRSADDQKTIFLNRLGPLKPKIVSEAKIRETLIKTAPPGYSRHHTGYTVDLSCENETDIKFEQTSCFKWLSKDNYLNAKKHGWIPSYPEETESQGPEPESWEYVWVGIEALYE